MNKKPKTSLPPRPPRWAFRFLEWYCKPSLYEDLQGDLHEYFERNLEKRGSAYAKVIYVIDVLKFFRLYTVQKPQILKRMNQFVMFGNYFKTSVRSMSRNKLFTTINVAGLAVSMTVGLFMISLLYEIRSYDNFHKHADRIFRLVNNTETGGEMAPYATTSILAGTRAGTEIPGVEDVVFLHDFRKDIINGENAVALKGSFAGEGFFSMFSFELLEGDPATALSEPFSIVLSQSAASKLFGNNRALGRLVETGDGENFLVTGIVRDAPRNSHLQFDCLASWATYINHEVKKRGDTGWWMHWQTMWESNVYLLLEKSASAASVQEGLDRIAAEQNAKAAPWQVALAIQPLSRIMHEDRYNQDPVLDQATVGYMLLLSIFVIVSACFNYTNLSVARALRRAKEVGVRKVIGASQAQVISQFLLEAVVVSLFSLVLAFALFYLLRNEFILFIESFTYVRLSLPVFSAGIYFLLLAILVGLGSGILPAILYSRLKAFNVLKGSLGASRTSFPFHKVLVVFQFALSITFIVGATLVYKQYLFSRNFDLGYNTGDILNVELQGNKPEILKNELEKMASVSQVSFSGMVNSVGSTWSLQLDVPGKSIEVFYNPVDESYLQIYQHTFLAGENFRHQGANAGLTQIIINEHLLRELDLTDPAEAIGKTAGNDWGSEKMVIVGVVKDFHYDTVHEPIKPFAYILAPQYRFANIALNTEPFMAMEEVGDLWNRIDRIHEFKASFHDQRIQEVYTKYSALSKGIGFLAIISISIASLGLLGMVIFTTEKRLKEISIRKVLGARELQLVKLLGQGFLGLLLLSTFIAVPLAWYLGNQFFLQQFTYKASFGFLDLFAGVIAIFLIASIAVGTQTLKAARTNPANILRSE